MCAAGTVLCDGSNGYGTCRLPYGADNWLGVKSYSTCTYGPMNGEQGSAGSYPFRATVGDVTDVTIWGRGKAPHPFHIHVNHMQLVSYSNDVNPTANTEGVWGKAGDWRDTVPALAGHTVAKTAFRDYAGETVLHCHFLKHEDMGMMDTIYVSPQPTAAPTAFPTVVNQQYFFYHFNNLPQSYTIPNGTQYLDFNVIG